MEIESEKLIVEINDSEIKYAVFQLDEKSDYEILRKKISKNLGIQKGKIIDISNASNIVGQDLEEIEKKLNKVFRNVSVVIDQEDILCTNLTGFKKLNGSKVEKRDLDYILNEGKSSIIKNQRGNSILHIFNSNFILDKIKQEKIPLNISGDHLSLHMTFVSIPKNNLKNITTLFANNDLKIERVINKPFASGVDLLNKKKDLKNFIIINFDKELTNVSLYQNSSLIFLKTFPLGTNLIYRDVAQLCRLEADEIQLIINELDFNNFLDVKATYLDEKFFKKSSFTRISIPHFKNIISARIEEITNYVFNKNKDLSSAENEVSHIHLSFEDKNIYKNLGTFFKKHINTEQGKKLCALSESDDFSALRGAAELIFKGWRQEAIPFVNRKRSIISSFFSRFF
tara:strand:- start:3071 stop:4267 length:1197 start_codon:yes stop_codon:yes gene_type:complete